MSTQKKKSFQGGKSRFFSFTTYASEKQIQKVVLSHNTSIRALCYIHHDQDEAEPHFHILMRTHSAWTAVQIVKWFADLKDKEKKPINTFCEIANDMESLKRYILHDTEEAREAGKHQYSPSDIKDFGIVDLTERKDCYDSSYEILLKILAGTNPRELVRYYGRDYLYHFNAYHECADRIQTIEGYGEARLFAQLNINQSSIPEKTNLKEVEDINDL